MLGVGTPATAGASPPQLVCPANSVKRRACSNSQHGGDVGFCTHPYRRRSTVGTTIAMTTSLKAVACRHVRPQQLTALPPQNSTPAAAEALQCC
eukprot:359108-Chlamydomonas_euryale.AAC.8